MCPQNYHHELLTLCKYGGTQTLTNKPQLAILVLHHITKAAENSRAKYLPLSAIRGATAFAAALDNAVTLDKKAERGTAISRVRYCYRQGRLADERKFDLEWQPDGSYKDVTDPNCVDNLTKSERKRLAVIKAIEENPDFLNYSGQKLAEALEERGIKVGKTTSSAVIKSYRKRLEGAEAQLEGRPKPE